MQSTHEFDSLKRQLFDKYFSYLNPKQREAVFSTEGPLLVLAGAGSGKTTVIVNRIANIILFGRASSDKAIPQNAQMLVPMMRSVLKNGKREHVREMLKMCAVEPAHPYRVLCITFTNKAAKEFKERLEKTLGDDAQSIWAGTFHSICVRILRRFIDRLGYKNDFTIYDTDDCKKLITSIIKELNIAESVLPPKTVMHSISMAKENDRTPEELALDSGFDLNSKRIALVYSKYQQKLKAANALDFDDIIMLANRLFETHRDVLDIYREQFKYILVDEYQDTNPSQSRLVAFLSGKHKNVCVVGDDDQSIYSFRGATVENILGFDKSYSNVKTVRLEQNYRSAGNILAAANGIISHNADRKGKELWTEADDGERVHLRKVEGQAEEAEFICKTIEEKVKKGKSYSDFAVLYRVNALSQSLETAFVKKRIPYKIFGGLRFYERREIKDIIAYLSVIANPSDSVRLRRIINVPKRAIGETTVERAALLADDNGISMFSVVENANRFPELQRASQKLVNFAALIKKLREFAHNHTLSQTVSEVIEATGYRLMLAEEDEGTEREENVLELVSSAKLFEETAENPTLAEFLNEIALVSDLDSYDSGSESVSLMTVHSAKGLEFDTVFVPGFEEGLFPSVQSFSAGDRAIEEERRLAYVAVTRAKKELFLINTDSRMIFGRTESRQPSRFANEIPQSARDIECVSGKGSYTAYSPRPSQRSAETRSKYLENIRANAQNAEKPKFFEAGSTVVHPMFGEGEILSATPMGGDVLYEIEFSNGSVKRIMGSFARLKSK